MSIRSTRAGWVVRVYCSLATMFLATGSAEAAGTVAMTIVHQFDSAPGSDDGAQPGTVAFESDGALYGTTFAGGAYGEGTIFRIGVDGGFSTIYTFKGPDGNSPDACLVPGADGNLYGTVGSFSSKVRVFRVTPAGELTLLALFFPELGSQDQRSVIVRASDGQRYAASSYGISSFVLVQQAQAARGTPAFQILPGVVPTGVNVEHPNFVSLEPTVKESAKALSQPASSALCGDITPARDGHFWKAPLIRGNDSLGPPVRSVSANLRDGFQPAVPMYKPRPAPILTENPDWRAASGASGRLAEDKNGVMLAAVGEHEIIGITTSAQIARHILLAPLGGAIYSVMGLLRASDGYFYGLALVDGYNGSIMIYRMSAEGPPEVVYQFPQSGPRETIRSPLVEGPGGSLYVTSIDGGKGRRGAIYRVNIPR